MLFVSILVIVVPSAESTISSIVIIDIQSHNWFCTDCLASSFFFFLHWFSRSIMSLLATDASSSAIMVDKNKQRHQAEKSLFNKCTKRDRDECVVGEGMRCTYSIALSPSPRDSNRWWPWWWMNKIKTLFEHKWEGAIYDVMFHVVSRKKIMIRLNLIPQSKKWHDTIFSGLLR